ncbi:DNA polymerase-1 [Lysinibacillus composti]|uniref:5'-3' exonuclease n=1 Tax=Lysinibacillus composti TaxID=720633 RepID=A0A3N9UJK9_9BACI|nr:5'-3' exonuclease [Lysinibacillus composti]MBM7607259.1 DNA polymerase-1 [Lysinibacillus composti]RQW76164.1 5'-3' exonuclease [Lysinibacillus composti]
MLEQISLFDELIIEKKEGYSNWVLVDGNNLLNRCYYPTENSNQSAPDGRPTNAVTLFVKMILGYQKDYSANIAVFFDKGKGFRKKLYPPYKEGRKETPERLKLQFPLIREVLAAASIPYFWDEQLEADDLIAAACKSLSGHKYVISNDKDLLQVLSDDVTVVVRNGSKDKFMTPEQFALDWEGLEPKQICEIKALAGDSSDNIPGVVGIGDTGAMAIIKQFGCVENITLPLTNNLKRYDKKFEGSAMEDAKFFKELTTLKSCTPLQINKYEINKKGLYAISEQLAMRSIINLLNKA